MDLLTSHKRRVMSQVAIYEGLVTSQKVRIKSCNILWSEKQQIEVTCITYTCLLIVESKPNNLTTIE